MALDPGELAARIGSVRVRPRADLQVTRQVLRDDVRYVVHDPVQFRNRLLTAREYRVFGALDGARDLRGTLARLVADGVLHESETADWWQFVVGLHAAGLLVVPGLPVDTVIARQRQRMAPTWRWRALLLGFRWSAGSPMRWLDQTLPLARWLFTRSAVVLWVMLWTIAGMRLLGSEASLAVDPAQLLAVHNLPWLWVALVVLKFAHECGHGWALRRHGAAVPEWGISLVLGTPCAWLDASASWTLPGRWQRLAVAGAGVWVESWLAGFAALIWSLTGPGFVHDFALAVLWLATVTTLFANANPLVRFDGYFVLADLTGQVNLQERASAAWRRTLARWFLGVRLGEAARSRGEALGLHGYGLAAAAWRVALAAGIVAWLWSGWPWLGLLLAVAASWWLLFEPIGQAMRWAWASAATQACRLRARAVVVASAATLVTAWIALPISRHVVAPGVYEAGARRQLHAPAAGFIDQRLVADGAHVQAGEPVLQLRDPLAEDRLIAVAGDRAAVAAELAVVEVADPVTAGVLRARAAFLERQEQELHARVVAGRLCAPLAGTVAFARVQEGSHVGQGTVLATVHGDDAFVRVVLTGPELIRARVDLGTQGVLRWHATPMVETAVTVAEVRRSASRRQVPVELTRAAGGAIVTRAVGDSIEAAEPYIHVFFALPEPPCWQRPGATAAVCVATRVETLGEWLVEGARQAAWHWASRH
ncbi:MAG: hypothetical protein IPK26_30570 [Planctomycetes bacterium]|nr:hypothetical protein [Planctomycetota bacterium]